MDKQNSIFKWHIQVYWTFKIASFCSKKYVAEPGSAAVIRSKYKNHSPWPIKWSLSLSEDTDKLYLMTLTAFEYFRLIIEEGKFFGTLYCFKQKPTTENDRYICHLITHLRYRLWDSFRADTLMQIQVMGLCRTVPFRYCFYLLQQQLSVRKSTTTHFRFGATCTLTPSEHEPQFTVSRRN